MSDLPTPTASRLRAPSWRDSRLLVGLLLVLVSTVLGSVVVARADDRVPVYAAKGDLAPGQRLTDADVVRVDVLLGDGAAGYLPADRPLAADTWSLRALRPGELIPVVRGRLGRGRRRAAGRAAGRRHLRGGDLGGVGRRRLRQPTQGGHDRRPADLCRARARARGACRSCGSPAEDGVLGGSAETRAVHVMVPRDSVRDVVADVDLGARITLVPVPGGVAAAAS